MFVLSLLVCTRFIVFKTLVKFQKSDLRAVTLNQNQTKITEIILLTQYLYIDANGIEWEDNNQEIFTNNKHFEVISIQKNKGYVRVKIIEDEQENGLYNFFVKNREDNSDLALKTFSESVSIFLIPSFQLKYVQPQQTKKHLIVYHLKNGIDFNNQTIKPPRGYLF